MKQWVISAGRGIDKLEVRDVPIPDVGENEVLVKFHAVSLNYRDIMIAKGDYHWSTKSDLIPASDGAGEVVAVGPKVTLFQKGHRVSPTYFQDFHAGILTVEQARRDLGGNVDGVMTEYSVFNENGLVEISPNLSYREAATLPCAGLTAWNALYGGKAFQPGVTVLTQGTGGVSMFAVQFALAGGAQVIATTSSGAKGKVLRKLGVHHVINYKEDKEWGQTAKKLSIGQRGADHIVEIGGPNTFAQSSVAAAIEGTVAVIGTRGGKSPPGSSNAHTNLFSTRRIMVGNRLQFEEMNRAIVANNIKPVLDEKSFRYDQVVEAYHYLDEGNHIGKVVVDVI